MKRIARPILIGRPHVIAQRIEKFGLRLQQGEDYDVVQCRETTPATATSGKPTTA